MKRNAYAVLFFAAVLISPLLRADVDLREAAPMTSCMPQIQFESLR